MPEQEKDCAVRTFEMACEHVKRAVTWRIIEVVPTETEVKKLLDDAAKVHEVTLQKYLVWRRSVLTIAVLPVLLSAILGLAEISSVDFELLNGFGILLSLLVLFDSCFLFAAVLVALRFWNMPLRSTRWLGILWSVSVILPLLPALFPLEYVVTSDFEEALRVDEAQLYAFKVYLAVAYAIQLLPIVITFPAGAWRGALRIRGLLPRSSLAGWILLLSAPFYSIFVLVALVVIMQVTGNVLLLIGTVMLTISPWIAVARRQLYLLDPTKESELQLDRTQKVILVNNIIAFTLILIWAFTEGVIGDGENALLSYGAGIRLVFEMIGRVLVTTLVFGDRLLQMTVTDWRISKMRQNINGQGEEIDLMFSTLEEYFPNESFYNGVANDGTAQNNDETAQNTDDVETAPQTRKKKHDSMTDRSSDTRVEEEEDDPSIRAMPLANSNSGHVHGEEGGGTVIQA